MTTDNVGVMTQWRCELWSGSVNRNSAHFSACLSTDMHLEQEFDSKAELYSIKQLSLCVACDPLDGFDKYQSV